MIRRLLVGTIRCVWQGRRRRLAFALAAGIFAAGLSWLLVFVLWNPRAFPVKNMGDDARGARTELSAPLPLTEEELGYQSWLSHVTWALPAGEEAEYWGIGGRQYGLDSVRYHAAFAGYAAAAIGLRTPAYTGVTGKILKNAIERLIDPASWRYIGGYWKDAPGFPDPCAKENIMYTGHLLQLLVFYEAITGDASFREQGFDLVWSETAKFHYTTRTLAERVAGQMRESANGGVACEPGLVFFACNNHPQVALLLLERMGLGEWPEERRRWEDWSLASLHAPAGGIFRLFYDLNRRWYFPVGLPGGDAWALLWYVPWAGGRDVPQELWRQARSRFDPAKVMAGDDGIARQWMKDCCVPDFPPPAVAASFLAAAARACGDRATAEAFEHWLDRTCLVRTAEGNFLNAGRNWRIAATANRALAAALANGSDLRQFVQFPPERAYFQGPLLTGVEPATTQVRQAYRTRREFVAEIDGHGKDVLLTFKNLPAGCEIKGIPPSNWHFENGMLRIANAGRQTFSILW